MGRAPCYDQNGLKKGPWTPEEDQKLVDYIHKHGYGTWRTLPKNAGLQRCGKSCRLRWTNYLKHDIKRGTRFSFEEEEKINVGNNGSSIRVDDHLSKLAAFHAVFGSFIGLLVALVGVKFQVTGKNPFDQHYWIMAMSICASFVYTITLVLEIILIRKADDFFDKFTTYIYLISGLLTCELLGFVLGGTLLIVLMTTLALLLVILAFAVRRHRINAPPQQAVMVPMLILEEVPATNKEESGVAEVRITIPRSEGVNQTH